jgi:hypothetical protein
MEILFKKRTARILSIVALISATFTTCETSVASASNILFTGQNAGLFPTANPNDTAILMNSVPKKNATASTSAATSGLSTYNAATLIENALASQISNRIYTQIFSGSATAGNYDLGGGNTIHYSRSGGYITIDITSPATGTTTIVVPDATS